MQDVRAASATVALLTKNKSLASTIVSVITDETTRVLTHTSTNALLAAVASIAPDVVIIDDGNEGDAAQQIRLLRRRQPSVYVVFIGVRNEQRSIALLHWGADDAIEESSPLMVARLQAAARRARTLNAGARIVLGDIVFDRESRRVWCAGKEVVLTPHEYDVVDCLFWHAPKPVGVDTLADFVWGDDELADRRTQVQVYVSYVRKKLASSAQLALLWSRDIGYQFLPKQGKKKDVARNRKP
jgi:two-component system OmpR family response regulator